MKYNDDAIHLPTGAEVTILRELQLANADLGTLVLFQFEGGATGLAFRHDIMPVTIEEVLADTVVSIKDIVHEVVAEIVDEESEEAAKRRRRETDLDEAREREASRRRVDTIRATIDGEPVHGDKVTVGKGKQVWTVDENHSGLLNLTREGQGRTKLQASANNVTKASN